MVQFSLHVSLIFPFFSVVIVVIMQYSSCHTMIWVIQAQLSGLQIMDKICITKKKTVWGGDGTRSQHFFF